MEMLGRDLVYCWHTCLPALLLYSIADEAEPTVINATKITDLNII